MDHKDTEQKPIYIPKCPTCGSPDIRRVTSREANWRIEGAWANHPNLVCKTFICNNCGYAW